MGRRGGELLPIRPQGGRRLELVGSTWAVATPESSELMEPAEPPWLAPTAERAEAPAEPDQLRLGRAHVDAAVKHASPRRAEASSPSPKPPAPPPSHQRRHRARHIPAVSRPAPPKLAPTTLRKNGMARALEEGGGAVADHPCHAPTYPRPPRSQANRLHTSHAAPTDRPPNTILLKSSL